MRGRRACAYCGTPAPPPAPVAPGAAAVCVCGVLAQTRCTGCDTPVCGGHLDTYWRGMGDQGPSQDPAERAVWDWATRQPAVMIWGTERVASPQACTVCRAINAEQTLDRYRARGPQRTDFERQVAAYAAGAFVDLIPAAPTPRTLTEPVLEHLRSRNWPIEPVATVVDWKRGHHGLAFTPVELDRGMLITVTPIQGAALNPSHIMLLEARCLWLLLGLNLIVGQQLDGAVMFSNPATIQRLAAGGDKKGRLTMSAMLGVRDADIDADGPTPERFGSFWRLLLVSLAGVSAVEHHTPDGAVHLGAGMIAGLAIRPQHPPQV